MAKEKQMRTPIIVARTIPPAFLFFFEGQFSNISL
ncbi:MAG: hypothetical protein JWR54_2845 [Mucilaginibacter sp.]|nr:hypothetical protein [Mucilaginibacter sp.]